MAPVLIIMGFYILTVVYIIMYYEEIFFLWKIKKWMLGLSVNEPSK